MSTQILKNCCKRQSSTLCGLVVKAEIEKETQRGPNVTDAKIKVFLSVLGSWGKEDMDIDHENTNLGETEDIWERWFSASRIEKSNKFGTAHFHKIRFGNMQKYLFN